MLFEPRPPMFETSTPHIQVGINGNNDDPPTQVMRSQDEHRETIRIQGKWSNIRRIVRELIEDGWRYRVEPTGEPSGFHFTDVELER